VASLPLPLLGEAETVRHTFPLCGTGKRVTCIVDGDTFWLAGEKIRIADIDTPEISSPQCSAEARLGSKAKIRLQRLLNAGPFELRSGLRDEDRYGRKLRTVHRNGTSLGHILVVEGLAHRWEGYKESWCGNA
jgi:endonuclease YncB( thermonuclease family)